MRRRARIRQPGALQPHDHVAWFGEVAGELYSVATAAFADGARRGEKLMFVAEDPDPSLFRGVDGLERLLATGQLELLPVDAVYGTGNAFSAGAQLARFEGVLADALSDGYRGIRVVADNTRLVRGDDESFRRWLAWEQLTDRFQSASMVTGVCFFDHAALSCERQADLAALHPVRSASTGAPPFSVSSDGNAVFVTGRLDASSAEQFRRILTTAPVDRPLVVDLSCAEFADRDALLVLGESASADRPLRLRGDHYLRVLVSLIGPATPHLHFEQDGGNTPTCTRCDDMLGVDEPTVIGLEGERRVTSRAPEPDAVGHVPERYDRACRVDR
jgi:MEDS: MEthanogen/methylotroph, DcmR Sensory domain